MSRFLILLLILPVRTLPAQSDSLKAEQMLVKAKASLQAEQWDSSDHYIAQARQFFKSKNMLAPWLKTFASLTYVWGRDLNQPSKGVELIEQALREKWREPISTKEWEQYATNLLAAGHVLRVHAADYLGAKIYYERAQEIFQQKMGEHSDRIARYLYHNLGNIYTRLGDYDRAIALLRRSLNYYRLHPEAKVVDHGDLAIALNEVNQYHEAILVVRQGLDIKDLSNELKISLVLSEADAIFRLGQAERALTVLEQIPGFIRQLKVEEGGVDALNYQSQYEATKSELLSALKQYGLAYKHGLQAVVLGKSFWGTEKRREIGKVYCLLGRIDLEQKRPLEALANYHHALVCVLPGLSQKQVQRLPLPSTFYSENTILEALQGKAHAFFALDQPEKALECYELIPYVEAKLRSTHAYESSSLVALKDSRQRFQEAVDIAWQLHERSNGDPQFAERAFRLTELARGMLLLQSLVQARQYLPENLRKQEHEIRVRMAWLEHEIAAEKEKIISAAGKGEPGGTLENAKIAAWERRLFELKFERQKLLTDFPSYDHPDSLFLQVLAARDVQKLLRKGQIMVNYFLTESAAYVFSTKADGALQWRKALLPPDFRAKTRDFVSYLSTGETLGREKFLQHALFLDSLLLRPELSDPGRPINSLVLVPDDILVLVPFEVLLRRLGSAGGTWRDQAWLLAEYNLSYAYSATLLNQQKGISEANERSPEKPSWNFGGFAAGYTSAGLYPLQNTYPMVDYVCSLLHGQKFLKADCSEAQFKKSASTYRTLLLAMHGISDADHPELSCLLFGDPGPDSLIDNNILYASELQIMRLRADLVVLSACHSGTGKLEQGEGVYSLARAFAAAGVPATVMSLWLLHENTARPILEAFFRNLKQGMTKDEALRKAKLEFLKKDENFEMTHPFYWAGLAALGDMRALDLPEKAPHPLQSYWVLITLVAAAAIVWGWKLL